MREARLMAAKCLIVTETKFDTTIQSIDRDFYSEAGSFVNYCFR